MQGSRHDIGARYGDLRRWFWGLALAVLGSLFAAIATGYYLLAALPALLLVAYLAVVDFRAVFLLLLACIPLSTEVQLPNGFGTDLPTEPLIVGLMVVSLLYVLRHGRRLDAGFLTHPLSLLLLLHVGWIAVTTLTSSAPFISFKFLLAKLWYIATFYFLAGLLLQTGADLRRCFWVLFFPLLLTVVVVFIRHAATGFSFAEVHAVLNPFYRNHVAYAAIMVTFFPLVWTVRRWYPPRSWQRRLLTLSVPFLLLAIYFSYTRAAYVGLLIAGGAYFVIRWRLTKYALLSAAVAAVLSVAYFAAGNRYLEYSPNYERTITHRDFENLLEATYQGEDISTMERVYRWIAGFYMSRDKPVFGFGPGNFYNFYKGYTVKSFRTYISDNEERSGIHSYYLMTLVEQGLPGLLLFLTLVGYALLRGEVVYHRLPDPEARQIAMMVLLSLIVILALLIINDLIETDKIGSFFFIHLALLVNLDRRATNPSQ